VDRYVDAWERCDVEAFASMLAEDATFAMPPLRSWYQSRTGIAIWAAASPMSGDWRWRTVFVRANGQPALGFYAWNEAEQSYLPFALNVLTLRGDRISDVTAFITRSTDIPDREVIARLPEQPAHAGRLAAAFENFDLPERLTD
jgi:RNA polymerase sigma-70 factor (ECF subfamily)